MRFIYILYKYYIHFIDMHQFVAVINNESIVIASAITRELHDTACVFYAQLCVREKIILAHSSHD